ncbi:MAG: sulfotransferase [Deltaproteobacteria bacterium]|nr:sulfotransferase [Deltaproteobacteria bacterium]
MATSAETIFEASVLLADARGRTDLEDFGDDDFLEPMRRLLAALEEEARLSEMGRVIQYERMIGLLVNRLRTEEEIRRHPEILAASIERPLAVVGLGRTGTTMLHRTIASDPRMFALLWYESRNPAAFPVAGPGAGDGPDPRIADAEAEVQMMLDASPDLIAAHPMDAHAPDEEIMLLEHAFVSGNPEAFCNLPVFARWLEDYDARPGYAYLKRLLKLVQWQKRCRGEPGERWVLKTPHHLGFLDVFFEIFPDARVVLTHRDPVQTIPSMASLIHAIRVLNSDDVDPVEIGRQWSGRLVRMMDRCMDVHEKYPERFLDLHYEDLVADPMAQVRRIYDFIGMPLTAEAETCMREWAVENTRDRRPVHSYTLEQFGFTEEGLRSDFARYRKRFFDRAD